MLSLPADTLLPLLFDSHYAAAMLPLSLMMPFFAMLPIVDAAAFPLPLSFHAITHD